MLICGVEIKCSGRFLKVARLAAEPYDFLDNPEALVHELRSTQSGIDIFSFTRGLNDPSPKYPYYMEWENFAALPVSTFENWWNNQIRSYPRNRARQAEKKGVVLREVPFDDVLVEGIWKVYNECPVRQGRPFRHYGMNLETVRKAEATFLDSSLFIGAFLQNELIGFIKLTWDHTRTQANMMNIISMMRHKDKAPTNALIAQAVRSCAERNIPYLVYQSYTYGKKKPDSVTHFKEINGFEKIDVPRYYIPLTARGRLGLRLGLHHELVDLLPGNSVAKIREARMWWYNRKLKNFGGSSE